MIFQKLLESFSKLFEDYKINNESGFVWKTVTAYSIDHDLKQKKIESSNVMKKYLEELIGKGNSACTVEVMKEVQKKINNEQEKMMKLRQTKNTSPATYDAILETCDSMIWIAQLYWERSGLKTAKEEDLKTDPRAYMECLLLQYVLEIDLKKCLSKESPKLGVQKYEWTDFKAMLSEKQNNQIANILFNLNESLQGIKKNEPRYFIIIKSILDSAQLEELNRCKEVKENPSLSSFAILLESIKRNINNFQTTNTLFLKNEEEKKRKFEEAEATVHQRYSKLYPTNKDVFKGVRVDKKTDQEEDSSETLEVQEEKTELPQNDSPRTNQPDNTQGTRIGSDLKESKENNSPKQKQKVS